MNTFTVNSRDGTSIAYRRTGVGAPLILVHGTSSCHTSWYPVLPFLREFFSVYAVDRRGRGASDDGPTYALDKEFEDLAALVEAIGEPAHVLGHSFGGMVALEAALLAKNISKLILYEPISIIDKTPEAFIQRVDQMIEAGDLEGALMTFLLERAHIARDELELFRAAPTWMDRVQAAPIIPRELRAHNAYRIDWEKFEKFPVPTLLLAGSQIEEYKRAVQKMAEALPNARLRVLEGHGHAAQAAAPDDFAMEIREFLSH